jgi:hypothetical protein
MKINKFYLIAIILFSLASNAQITKGNWMMGGAAAFSHNKNTIYGKTSEGTVLSIAPNVGYFFIDKLAVGTSGRLTYTIAKNGDNLSDTNYFNYGIGPFVRYYFLEKEKPLNIFSEISYGFEKINQTDTNLENFNAKVGAVYFLNNSVGIEVALNYLSQKFDDGMQNGTNNNLFLGIGFQIHLEKE